MAPKPTVPTPDAAAYTGDDPQQQLARRIKLIMRARPELKTDMALIAKIAAQTNDDEAAVKLAGDVSAGSAAQQMINQMRDMPHDVQRSKWKELPVGQQVVLTAFGYKPPKRKSFFDIGLSADNPLEIAKSVGKLAIAPGTLTKRAAVDVGGKALDALNAPVTAVKQGADAAVAWGSGRGDSPIGSAVAAVSHVAGPVVRAIGSAERQIPVTPITPFMKIGGRALERIGTGLSNVTTDGSQHDAAAQVHVAEAAGVARQAVVEGKLTQEQFTRLYNDPKALLDWYDDHQDPDMPSDLQTWRSVSGSLGDAWHASRTGKLISPTAELAARKEMGEDVPESVVMLAKQLAIGKTPDDILLERGLDPRNVQEWNAKRAELLSVALPVKNFDKAVALLSQGKFTLGSDVANGLGYDLNTQQGRFAAGAIDAGSMFVLDPTLVGGKALTAFRETRYLLETATAAEKLRTASSLLRDAAAWRRDAREALGVVGAANEELRLRSFGRAADRIAKAFADPTGGELAKLRLSMPGLRGTGMEFIAQGYRDGFWRNAPDLLEYMGTAPESILAAHGRAFARSSEIAADGRLSFPYLTRRMELTSNLTASSRRVVEAAAAFGGEGIASKVISAPFKPLAMLARIPEGRHMAIDDNEAFARLLTLGSRSGWDQAKTDRLFREYLLGKTGLPGETLGMRRSLVGATITDMLDTLGINRDMPGGVGAYGQALLDRLSSAAYATESRDLVRGLDGVQRPTGLYAGIDEASNVQIPTYRELAKAANTHFYGARMYGVMNPDWLINLTTKWKENVLLRAGFAMRVGGEEVVAFSVREGLGAYLKSVGAAANARNKILDDIDHLASLAETVNPKRAADMRAEMEKLRRGWLTRPFTAAMDKMALHVGEHVTPESGVVMRRASQVAGITDRAVAHAAAKATEAWREVVGSIGYTDPAMVEAARNTLLAGKLNPIVAHPDMIDATIHWLGHDPMAMEESIGRVTGHGYTWHPAVSDTPGLIGSYYADRTEVATKRVLSNFELVPVSDERWEQGFVAEASRVMKSPMGETVRRTLGSIIPEDTLGRQLVDSASSTRWAGERGIDVVRNLRNEVSEITDRWADTWDEVGSTIESALPEPMTKAFNRIAALSPQQFIDQIADGKGITSGGRAGAARALAEANAKKDRVLARELEGLLRKTSTTEADFHIAIWKSDRRQVQKFLAPSLKAGEAWAEDAANLLDSLDDIVKHVDRISTREAVATFNDLNPRSLKSVGQVRDELYRAVRKTQGTERLQRWFNWSERAIADDGVPVARPLPDGHAGTYWPAWTEKDKASLAMLRDDPSRFPLYEELDDYRRKAVDAVLSSIDETGSPTLAVGEYRTAQELHALVTEVLGGEPLKPSEVSRLTVNGADIRLTRALPREWKPGNRIPTINPIHADAEPAGRILSTDAFYLGAHKIEAPALIHPDGSTIIDGVVRPGASREMALESWARDVTDQIMDTFTAVTRDADGISGGTPLHEIIHAAAREDDAAMMDRVRGVPVEDRSASIKSLRREISVDKQTMLKQLTKWGWSVSDGQLNAIARHPMFIHYYGEAKRGENVVRDAALALQPDFQAAKNLMGVSKAENEVRLAWIGLGPFRAEASPEQFLKAWDDMIDAAKDTGKALPAFTHEDARTIISGLRAEDQIESLAAAASREQAVRRMSPFIHNVKVRSQFSEFMTVASPFRFAEEQFLGRWVNTLRHTPEAFHRLQLVMGALHTMGFVEKDEYGNDVFHVPVLPAVYHLMSHVPVVSSLLNLDGHPPLGSDFAFAIQNLSPGLADPLHFGTSPFLRVPVAIARRLMPETKVWRDLDKVLAGGHNDELLSAFFPGWQKEVVKGILMRDGDAEVMRAMTNAMQMMAAEATRLRSAAAEAKAAGQTKAAAAMEARANELEPEDTNDVHAVEAWLDEVRGQARVVILTRALLGFGAPTSGRVIPKVGLTKEFIDILQNSKGADGRQITYGEALARYLAQHPNGLPYTVPDTESVSGARTNYSEYAGKWLADNAEFAAGHPDVAAWFLPPGDGSFDSEAYYQTVAAGWRRDKKPVEWLEDLKFAEAAPDYFASKKKYDAAMEANKLNPMERKKIEASWKTWKSAFDNTHPTFARMVGSNDRRLRRAEQRRSIIQLAEDGKLPKTQFATVIADMTASFDRYMATRQSSGFAGGSNMARSRKRQLDAGWRSYVDNFLLINPTAEPFYSAMIALDEPEPVS